MDQRKSKYLATERDCGRRAESIHAADGTGISIRLVKIISVMLGEIAETAEYFAQVCADCRAMYDRSAVGMSKFQARPSRQPSLIPYREQQQ